MLFDRSRSLTSAFRHIHSRIKLKSPNPTRNHSTQVRVPNRGTSFEFRRHTTKVETLYYFLVSGDNRMISRFVTIHSIVTELCNLNLNCNVRLKVGQEIRKSWSKTKWRFSWPAKCNVFSMETEQHVTKGAVYRVRLRRQHHGCSTSCVVGSRIHSRSRNQSLCLAKKNS